MHGLETIIHRNDAAAEKAAPKQPLELTDQIIAYEQGDMPVDQVPAFFQRLIDSGLAWRLQGAYGRTAAALIRAGKCHERPFSSEKED